MYFLMLVVSIGWFDSSGGADVLSLYSHVYFLCFFRPREIFGDIIDVDEWSGEIVFSSNGFEPRGFCWKTCLRMKIYYGLFNTWEFINVVYGFWCLFGHKCM